MRKRGSDIDRRAFLRLTLSAAGGLVPLAGCRPSTETAGVRSTPRAASTTSGPPTPPALASTPVRAASPTPGPSQWRVLAAELRGPLLQPGDPRYDPARVLFDPRFDPIRPAAIARCATVDDVRRCVRFAAATGVALAVRCGGHSYAGYSTGPGLVIDVRGLNGIRADANRLRVGAGVRLIDLYARLADAGLGLPAGSCPTVGITGLTLGGGIGVTARRYGLTCDRLTAVEVVTADGELIRADDDHDPDLLWAHRGGGGGNFGVVTALEFHPHRAGSLTRFVLRWPWAKARDVVSAWFPWMASAPDACWSSLHLLGADDPGGIPQGYVSGVVTDSARNAGPLLDDLVAAVGARPTTRFVAESDYLTTMLAEAGCRSLSECRPLAEGGRLRRESSLARSDFLDTPLADQAIDVLLGAVEERGSAQQPGGAILIDALGGAVNRIAADQTAFVHRTSAACMQYVVPNATGARRWLDEVWSRMRPFVGGFAYQNYIDPALPDWQTAYYGPNLPKLIRIKSAVDPHGVFSFPQGIPREPAR
ncbi:MAG: FAD-binding oxidoreductase [Acidothermus sp.]|nr:FAD-binding oxidoreductase [Acidothermus sp.]MCL6537578.1 FAD-binding oxidoreductase [Acidothermus sp.]